jgi:arylsulfatase A-like enzyme
VFRAARRAYRALARCLRRPEPPHVRAEEINSRAVAWLEDREGPFFLWLHYMDPHWPYGTELAELSPAERRGARRLSRKALRRPAALTGTELGRLRELYRLEVEYLDRSVGGLFDRLRRAGLWDGCAVALTSDHGQGFGEHGATFHGDLLYDELIRVPLIVRAPGLAPERREGVASLIDLSPTLCALAGLEAAATFEGRSLLDGPAREAVFAETAYRLFVSERPKRVAVRTADWKLIRNCEADTEELYDVEADPGETADLLDGRPEVAERMRRLLRGHLERERPPIAPDRSRWRPEEEEAVKARLRALGYMDEAEQ